MRQSVMKRSIIYCWSSDHCLPSPLLSQFLHPVANASFAASAVGYHGNIVVANYASSWRRDAGGRPSADRRSNGNAESRILELRPDDSQHRSVRCSVVARRNGTFVRSVSCDELVLSYEEWVSMASGKCLTL